MVDAAAAIYDEITASSKADGATLSRGFRRGQPVREDETKRGLLVEDLAAAIPNFVRRYAPF